MSKTLRLSLNADLIEDVAWGFSDDIRTAFSRIVQGSHHIDAEFVRFQNGIARLRWARGSVIDAGITAGLATYDVIISTLDGDDIVAQEGDVIVTTGESVDPADSVVPTPDTPLDGGGA